MQHVAIMKKSWGLLPKIVSGEKTIESRWYQSRRAPWGRIKQGETIYFRNSGEPVTLVAQAAEVMQFTIQNLRDARRITKQYGKEIGLLHPDPATWGTLPRYCILVRLKDAKVIKPFHIDKTGFGSAAAWLTAEKFKKM
jgi:hypothetical protein